jgi:methyltransferase family protein
VRLWRPARVIEVGAGNSTLVTAAACAANAADGHPALMTIVDPEPRRQLDPLPDGCDAAERRPVQEVGLERFVELTDRDILFVDSSHVVKLHSEVNFLVLEVLPALAEGVLVHFHDIFLPYEYPRRFAAAGMFLSEQYLLQAFLIENPHWEVFLATHALWREEFDALRAAVSDAARAPFPPSSFWMRRAPRMHRLST